MKIVYIVGLGHSGSTILDMALGCNAVIVGLGEISQLLKATGNELESHSAYNQLLCSCGQRIDQCNFWKGAKKLLIKNSQLSRQEKYIKLVEYFQARYGPDMILVDSSKVAPNHLSSLAKCYDLRIIFIVRDVRSWCYSRHSRLQNNIFRLALQWARINLGLLRFLKKHNLTYKLLGYEEIALYPEAMLKEICRFIEIEYDPGMLVPGNTNSHIVKGNVARADKDKRKAIYYDARWMTSLSIVFYGILLSPLMLLNRKLVYSNFVKEKCLAFGHTVDDFHLFGDNKKEQIKRTVEGKD